MMQAVDQLIGNGGRPKIILLIRTANTRVVLYVGKKIGRYGYD